MAPAQGDPLPGSARRWGTRSSAPSEAASLPPCDLGLAPSQALHPIWPRGAFGGISRGGDARSFSSRGHFSMGGGGMRGGGTGAMGVKAVEVVTGAAAANPPLRCSGEVFRQSVGHMALKPPAGGGQRDVLRKVPFEAGPEAARVVAWRSLRAAICGLLPPLSSPAKNLFSAVEASKALVSALQANDRSALLGILGRGRERRCLFGRPDRRQEQPGSVRREISSKCTGWSSEPDGRTTLYIGAENWPMPIPLAHKGSAWYFDTPQVNKKSCIEGRAETSWPPFKLQGTG